MYPLLMPKKLLVIRHAKAGQFIEKSGDFNRPLDKTGQAEALEMAKRLFNEQLIPQQILSSPALRAITTANYFANILGFEEQSIIQEKAIYEASASTLLHIINHFDDKFDFIALFGHNPGVSNLAIDLCNADIYNFPTCGVVLMEFPFEEWKMISAGTGEMKRFDYV